MTQLLMIVGVFVFFLSVYGAVMIGGHLLEELASDSDDTVTPAPGSRSAATSTSDAQAVAR